MPLETQGFGDLQNDLTNMAAEMEFGPGVNRALQAGAKPIEEQMLRNASSNPKIITDALHSSIHTGSVKKRRMGGKGVTIVKAEISGKGTFYRVRVPAGSRSDAQALCEKYKAAGGNCFVSK